MKVLNDQPSQPRDSQSLQSYSNGLKEIKVLCDEQPPRTLALECLICELPGQCKQRHNAAREKETTVEGYIHQLGFAALGR
jgi:hypothetical protein